MREAVYLNQCQNVVSSSVQDEFRKRRSLAVFVFVILYDVQYSRDLSITSHCDGACPVNLLLIFIVITGSSVDSRPRWESTSKSSVESAGERRLYFNPKNKIAFSRLTDELTVRENVTGFVSFVFCNAA